MTERKHYHNAPIIEATISFGIVPPTDLSTEDLIEVWELVRAEYPQMGEEYLYTGEVNVKEPGGTPEHDDTHEHIGYAFRTEDGQRIFSARLDGFDFSIGPPYGRWEEFRDEARRLWTLFKNVSELTEVARVALRYINRIDIPTDVPTEDSVKLDNYLKIYPEVPDDWPTGLLLQNFFMQVQAWQEDLNCNLIVNQAPGRPPGPGIVSIRLDFDLFKERYEEPWLIDNEEEIWRFLEKLHERKNELFETSIKDATRRLIK